MLPKPYRLPSNRILPVIKKGKFFPSKSFNIRWLEKDPTSPKAMLGVKGFKVVIVVPTRLDKRASKRNRVKRLFRESIRPLLPQIKVEGEMVILAKKAGLDISFSELSKEIREYFKKLRILET